MARNSYVFFFFILIISPLCAGEIMSEIVVDKPGSYHFERRVNNEIALVYTDTKTNAQTTRVLPPTVFPLTAIIQSGSATNQDIIQNLVTVAANDVIFNLNGFNLTQGLVISGKNVRVKNGLIDPTALLTAPFNSTSFYITNGINVVAGSANVIIDSVTVRNATSGIVFNSVSGGGVYNCEMLFTSTGLQLNQSNNIVVKNSTATQCTLIGFSLVSSTTNSFTDCTALNIGANNTTVINNNVAGFFSKNGYGNIFERCIANATQALSTTDFNSAVAGFALVGTEASSKIINCEAANAQTNSNGVTVPYGILLQATLNSTLTLTGVSPTSPLLAPLNCEWSSDGNYIAVGDTSLSVPNLYIYQYNYVYNVVTLVASANDSLLKNPAYIKWSPDGRHIAITDETTNDLLVYNFIPLSNDLIRVASTLVTPLINTIASVDWSPDGKYIAVANFGSGGVGGAIVVYEFDAVANALTIIAQTPAFSAPGAPLWASWSPDGQYIAVADENSNSLMIFQFSPTSSTITLITRSSSTLVLPTAVSWSPNGQYIAIYASTSAVIAIYHFNPTLSSLTLLASTPATLTSQFAPLSWSSDSRYVTFPSLSGHVIVVYQFDPGAVTFTQVASDTPNSVGGLYATWSPDGQYIASVSRNPVKLNVFQALTFPSTNVITNNNVYCNTGGSAPNGVGISGSSIANLIIQNTAYANPLQLGVNMPFVPTNYAFVQNVFNQNFGDAPTGLQNISMSCGQVVTTPANLALLAQQLSFDVFTSMQSALAALSSMLLTGTANNCLPIQVTAGTTISTAGIYCLGTSITNPLVINSSNVQLNLNSLTATGGIQVGAGFDQVTIFNGSVSNSTDGAITVTSGATNLTISQVRAHDSIIGINLTNVNSARISYCDLVLNTTGINLSSCVNVSIDNCIARSNLETGFSLVSSSTNVLRDCQALSTGDGLSSLHQNVFGFVSNNGSGNVFERCIANATRCLTVTAGDSIVAGFALRGSEQYSKIIGCESSNATTSPTGVTIPYGIWLEAQFSGLVSVTSVNPGGNNTVALSAKWSHDGVYLAVLPKSTTNTFIIYKFDYLKKGLVEVVRNTQPAVTSPTALVWSPDGNYLIVAESATFGTNNSIFLYRFDKLAQSVQLVTSINLGVAITGLVDWSPDGKYLAVTINPGGNFQVVLLIYQFDEVNQTLQQVATLPASQVPSGSAGNAVAWSPDGNYVALGLIVFPGTNNDFYLYRFDRSTQTLIQVDVHSIDPGSLLVEIFSIAWTFDGQYVAVGSGSNNGSFDVTVFQFNRTTQTLSFVAGLLVGSGGGFQPVEALTWSPDGKYLAFGGNIYTTGDTLYVYQFNRGNNSLLQVAAVNPDGGSVSDIVNDVEWSPDGQYLAVAGSIIGATNNAVIIYKALTFPNANVIMDNTVYCNSGASFPSGVGISGSSVANMIIQNNAYSNPLNKNNQNPLVPSNYVFVANVFNPILQNTPSLTQNIGIGDAQIVPQPQNTAFLAKQVNAQITQLGLCGPTTVLAATSITASGDYCLAQNITGDIIITSSYVQFDLNKRCIFGHVDIYNTGESLITNGFIRPPDPTTTGTQALLIGAGCVHVTASNLFIDASLSVTTANAVQGQDGVSIAGNDTQLLGCIIKGGSATAATTAGAGARGGYGISLTAGAARTIIQDCVVLQTGNGGAANGAANVGGDAGHGIHVASGVNSTKITNCLIMSTGSGGAGVSAAGGRGGDAVRVESGAQDIEVRNSRMRNTGTGGSGSTLGVPGKAVFDLVTTPTTLSSIFTNFAFSIANPTKFDIQASTIAGGPETGVKTPNPPTSGVINLFANVFSS